jgi:C1A family cysteine protease
MTKSTLRGLSFFGFGLVVLAVVVFSPAGGMAATPQVEWSLNADIVAPVNAVFERGAAAATAEHVDTLVSKLTAKGAKAAKTAVATDDKGITYALTASGSGTVESFREILYSVAKPQFNALGGVTEIHIDGAAADSTDMAVVLESNLSTGYRWHVATDSGMTQSASHKYERHTLGRGVPERQTVYLTLGTGSASSIKLVYKRSWETSAPTSLIRLRLSTLPATLNLSDPNAPEGAAAAPPGETPAATSGALKTADLPTKYDWRKYGIVTPVRDQGSCGSCWAFGTVGVMESALGKSGIKGKDLSEQFLLSCNEDGWNCADGGFTAHKYHYDTLGKNQTTIGAVLESDLAYSGTDGSCAKNYSKTYTLSGWQFITGSESTVATVAEIKNAMSAYGPVTAGVCAGDGWDNYSSGVFDTDETSYCGGSTNHQIILVGWNDNNGVDVDGYWILRNSWGADWGIKGYMYIKYGVSRVGEGTSWVTTTSTEALTVAKAGTGSGTITGGGISCGSTCSKGIKSGVSVTLTAKAATGSTFTGWSGDCTGAGACVLTMNNGKNVTASFTVSTYALTVAKAGSGAGTVSGASIDCGSTCSYIYNYGTTETLAAAPDAGSTFAGWSGACKGTGTCALKITAAKSVGATFNTCTYKISPTSRSIGYKGGYMTVSITSQKACPEPTVAIGSGYEGWLGYSNLSYSTSTGKGSVRITATANTGASRTGAATIGGNTFTAIQAAGK